MRNHLIRLAYLLLALPLVAFAQGTELKLPSFAGLQHKATESVDFTLGPTTLSLASWVLSHSDDDDPEIESVRKIVKGLKSVRIRNFQFDHDFAYSQSDIEEVRAQLSGPTWSQLVQVRDRKAGEDIDVYVAYQHDKIAGLAIVASEPREFTILNIVGEIDLDQIATLQKHVSLPNTGATRFAMRNR